jgi:UPF0755 protein
MRPFLLFIAFLMLSSVIGGMWGKQWVEGRYSGPGPTLTDQVIVVPRGDGAGAIARRLAAEGIIRSRLDLLIALRWRREPPLQAGEYALPAGISLKGVIDLLESGRTVVRRLTVPEGMTSREIVDLLRAEPALSGDVTDIPPDGSLLPETWYFSLGDSRIALMDRMRHAMSGSLAELWEQREPGLPLRSMTEAVILASIVEKETGIASERARVAGVFINRLRRGMRLQSDPTVIYALTRGQRELGRALTRADWKTESPFNTYFVGGLPPSAIANPGRAALAATIRPEKHDFLYFVADGTGGHAFSPDLEGHNRNVARWQKLNRETTAGQN